MSKVIDIHLSQLRFPSTCVVCASPATRAYELQKMLTRGRGSYAVRVNIPMCDLHFHSANRKGNLERWVGKFGPVAGILAGFFTMLLLLVRGETVETGNTFHNFVAAGIFATPVFLMVWVVFLRLVAPCFAERATRQARYAVRFVRYWPRDQFVRLEFQDEQLADIVQNTYRPPSSSKSFKLMSRTPGF